MCILSAFILLPKYVHFWLQTKRKKTNKQNSYSNIVKVEALNGWFGQTWHISLSFSKDSVYFYKYLLMRIPKYDSIHWNVVPT